MFPFNDNSIIIFGEEHNCFPMKKKPVLTKMNFLSSIDASINFIKDISFFYVENSFMYLTNLNLK